MNVCSNTSISYGSVILPASKESTTTQTAAVVTLSYSECSFSLESILIAS